MKKLFSFFIAALMSVSVFAAKDVVPDDAVLADYYNQGDVCVCFYVPTEMNCNNIVLTGSFNGWSSNVANCIPVEAVEGYDGWYVGSFEPEAEPDAVMGMQAKPVMLDVDGNFNWVYQIGDATAIRGGVQVVQGAYVGEIDMINYGADAPNVFTVDAWKENPCTAIYHNYTITVISDGCEGKAVPFIIGGMNNWTFTQMLLDNAKTAEYGVPTYYASFKAAEGTLYQILSGIIDPQTGDIEIQPYWNDDSYMQKLVDDLWVRIPGEDGDNQLTHEDANIVLDLRADSLRWARCAPAEPEEYTIMWVKLPAANAPEAVEIIGTFDDWAGTAMEKQNTGWFFVELEANASQYFKFRGAGSWDQQLEIYDAENNEWRTINDNELIFDQLWQDDSYRGTLCKSIEIDLSDPNMYRWSSEENPIPEPENVSTYTVRLDPNSVDWWSNAYAYVWTGSTSAYDAYDTYMGYSGYNAYPVVWAQQAQIDEEGWFAVSFQLDEGATYHLGWMAKNNGYPSSNSYILTNQTGSVCTAFNSNGSLQVTTCKNLLPDESNTYTIHVATAGTFGQVLVQALGTKTWTDVLALTVTGTLNEADMQYLGRMTNLQILDLSGTNIISIGGCHNLAKLSSVSLPATCITVNDNAFYGCYRLNSINLENIETVGNYAFYQCANFTSLNMPKVLSIGNYAFATDNNDYQYNSSSLQSATMPIVQTIGNYAFNGNQNLASIAMPLVNTIGAYAFCNCYALTQVDLSNVTSLGQYAFHMRNNGVSYISTGNLRSVTLSDELEIIPGGCFSGCDKLTSITFPSALKEIGNTALPYLTNVQLPDGLQTVGSNNFLNATSITIPASVTSWGSFSETWTDVYCYVVSPLSFRVFNTSAAAAMTLHVPAISMAAYRLHDNWYQFGQILPIEGNISELNINSDFLLSTTDGIANKANMIINNGAALTMSASQSLALGSYTQMISSANRQYDYYSYYDANDNYVEYYYSYLPYTGMLLANSPMIADGVDVKLVVRKDQWNFFSLPFDVNMADILFRPSYQWVIREYSGANRASGNGETWNNVPANGMLQAYKGYIIYMTDDSDDYIYDLFIMSAANNANKQNIFATNDVDVPLTEYSAEFPQNRSWNLIGNPYPCLFDIQQMDFEAPITTWNGNGYTAYSPLDDNYMLRPAEGFFVQAPQGTAAITFHKEGRSAINYQEVSQEEYYNNRYYAPRRAKANNVTRKVFNFTLSNDNYSDRARLVLNENASADYELNRDAAKMLSTDKSVPQLYISDNGVRYAINERPAGNGVYYMSAFFGNNGEYTIKVQSDEVQSTSIILTDTQTGVATDLSENDYIFTTDAGTFENRFVISFAPKMPTEVENVQGDNVQCTKVLRDGQLIIIRNGIEYNVNGQMTK